LSSENGLGIIVFVKKDKLLSVTQAAEELGISRQRVLQLIKQERLAAQRFANVYMIYLKDLESVRQRAPGRPRKK
jgi:excisionase family DNA binding protein